MSKTVLMRVAAVLVAAWPVLAQAQSAEDFFRGKKELNLITSSAAGGGYDSYSRLLAQHMSKYLPGNPTIVVQNMLGGGGIRAANYIYNVAPRDGTVFGLIDRGMPTAPLLYADKSQARFDAVKLTWIGSIMRETGMGVLSARSAVASIDDARTHPDVLRRDRAGNRSGDVCAARQRARRNQDQGHQRLQGTAGRVSGDGERRARRIVHERMVGPGRAYVRDQIGKGRMRLLVQMAPTRDPQHTDTPTISTW